MCSKKAAENKFLSSPVRIYIKMADEIDPRQPKKWRWCYRERRRAQARFYVRAGGNCPSNLSLVPKSLVTTAVWSIKTCKQLYGGVFGGSDSTFLACSQYFPLEPRLDELTVRYIHATHDVRSCSSRGFAGAWGTVLPDISNFDAWGLSVSNFQSINHNLIHKI